MELNDELKHYGVLGMKWGRRKYQNPDGSLTQKGKAKVEKKYSKYMSKVDKNLSKTENDRYFNSYNKAANVMNNGGIEKYNKQYFDKIRKKYGKEKEEKWDYNNDEKYISGYEKLFESTRLKYYKDMTLKEIKKDKNYIKAEQMVEKYGMTKFSDAVKASRKIINELSK